MVVVKNHLRITSRPKIRTFFVSKGRCWSLFSEIKCHLGLAFGCSYRSG